MKRCCFGIFLPPRIALLGIYLYIWSISYFIISCCFLNVTNCVFMFFYFDFQFGKCSGCFDKYED
jgi:hypothetical protein